jgi:hypothetical protein
MDQAAQAAPGKTFDEQALETLGAAWGDLYLLGYDDDHGWWSSRRGRVGGYLAEDTPDELSRAITDDFGPGR